MSARIATMIPAINGAWSLDCLLLAFVGLFVTFDKSFVDEEGTVFGVGAGTGNGSK